MPLTYRSLQQLSQRTVEISNVLVISDKGVKH